MKKILLFTAAAIAVVAMGCNSTKVSDDRNLAYEAYCDSIWETNPDYYMDCLEGSDEYCTYIEKHGQWWEE